MLTANHNGKHSSYGTNLWDHLHSALYARLSPVCYALSAILNSLTPVRALYQPRPQSSRTGERIELIPGEGMADLSYSSIHTLPLLSLRSRSKNLM